MVIVFAFKQCIVQIAVVPCFSFTLVWKAFFFREWLMRTLVGATAVHVYFLFFLVERIWERQGTSFVQVVGRANHASTSRHALDRTKQLPRRPHKVAHHEKV